MTSVLSAYEAYYQNAGLAEYERVFEHSNELEIEVGIYASRMVGWGCLAKTDLRILDIGCGLGTFTYGLLNALYAPGGVAPANVRLTLDAVDINPEAFERYSTRLAELERPAVIFERKLCLAWQDIPPNALADGYDLVIANHVFYGCACDRNLLKSVAALLKPGGLALLALASRQSNVYRMRREAGIRINCAEDIETALVGIPCNLARVGYESKLYFDPAQSHLNNWLFATSNANSGARKTLIARYSRDGDGRRYIANRALIHILEAPTLPFLPGWDAPRYGNNERLIHPTHSP